MTDLEQLLALPDGVTVEFVDVEVDLQPGVSADAFEIIPGQTSLLETYRRFGTVLDLEPEDEIEHKIALC